MGYYIVVLWFGVLFCLVVMGFVFGWFVVMFCFGFDVRCVCWFDVVLLLGVVWVLTLFCDYLGGCVGRGLLFI